MNADTLQKVLKMHGIELPQETIKLLLPIVLSYAEAQKLASKLRDIPDIPVDIIHGAAHRFLSLELDKKKFGWQYFYRMIESELNKSEVERKWLQKLPPMKE